MSGANTNENFEGASIPERIYLFNNTFVANDHGVTGGDSLVVVNNIFVDHPGIAMKNVDGGSIVSYGIYWNNGTDFENCNVDSSNIFFSDPLLDSQFHLQPTSPAIDAGTALFMWQGNTVLNLPSTSYSGIAPDLGAFEFGIIVPVELVVFEFVDGVLRWSTASETNNFGFEIQRGASPTGDFVPVGFVRGAGTTVVSQQYEFRDTITQGTVYYRLKQIDTDGSFELSPVVEANYSVPSAFALFQNYPNPFNPETEISFALTKESHVVINIYSTLGQEIDTLIDTQHAAGFHSVRWDGKDRNGSPVSSGVYLYQIQAGEFSQVRKMSLIR